MTRHHRLLVLIGLLAGVAGAAMGLFAPIHQARATTTVEVFLYAGVDYGKSYLNCGWHTGCTSGGGYERGLDFIHTDSSMEAPRYNGWAFSPDSTLTIRGVLRIGNIPDPALSGCPTSSVTIRDTQGAERVRFSYMHAVPGSHNGVEYFLLARAFSSGGYFLSLAVGTYDSGGTNCYTSGPHIHTWFASLDGTYNVIPRDEYWKCGTPSVPFDFPCRPGASSLDHDLTDHIYYSAWSTP